MTTFHLLLVAVVQGLTEFLPISSSGHLILIPRLTDLPDQGLTVDIAAHTGTLGAVVLYFRREFGNAVLGVLDLAQGRTQTDNSRLALCLVIATIPVVIVGAAVKLTGFDAMLRSLHVIGIATLGFGVLLYWSDQAHRSVKSSQNWTIRDAAIIGIWQIAALIPGASRSGVAITAARMCGYSRQDAARLSMLMSLPVICAATALTLLELIAAGDSIAVKQAAAVAGLSFVAALATLALLMRMVRMYSFTPFVIYRVVLGILLLTLAWL